MHSSTSRCRIALFGVISLLGGLSAIQAQDQAPIAPAWNWPSDAREVTCGAAGPDGRVFIGTLRSGMFVVDAAAAEPVWHRAQTKDGLGQDEITVLRVDRQGRLWVGHRSEGVSVFVGNGWHHFPSGKGPAGERVWDIAECPVDGDIWIVHDHGLTRYGAKNRLWQHVTRLEGLPTCHVRCIAFDPDGTLIVGTQSEGVLIANREGTAYPTFKSITGPEHLTRSPTGEGLPSGLINDCLVDQAGRWIVATDRGLAISTDKGESFTYHRGQEWALKLEGLYKPVSPDVTALGHRAWLPDDYVRTLAEDSEGRVWLGFWRGGVMALAPGSIEIVHHSVPHAGPAHLARQTDLNVYRSTASNRVFGDAFFAQAIVPRPGAPTLVLGMNNGGFLIEDVPVANVAATSAVPRSTALVPRPDSRGQKNGREAELAWAKRQLDAMPTDKPAVIPLSDDWSTQGDWIGRYGGTLGVLCAVQSPENVLVGKRPYGVRYCNAIGPHKKTVTFRATETDRRERFSAEDTLRYWVWEKFTNDRRAVQLPPDYVSCWIENGLSGGSTLKGNVAMHRRPCAIDDHSETYPVLFDGPHIQAGLDIPKGVHQIAFYFMSYDGEMGGNRARDHRLFVHHNTNRFLANIGDITALPPLAQGRVTDYFSGVYKRFIVRGPARLAVEANRNHSYNTMLTAVFMDAWPEHAQAIAVPERESLAFSTHP
jgi:hypothetical protein